MSDAPLPSPEPRDDDPPVDPPRTWWQFSLRTMFVLVTLLVTALAWFANGPERQRRAVVELCERGGEVKYSGETEFHYADVGSWIPRDYYQSVIEVRATDCPDNVLEMLPHLPGVKAVCLENVKLTETGITHLATQTSIEKLELSCRGIHHLLLAPLKPLPKLRALYLATSEDAPVGDAFFAAIGEFPHLEELELWNYGKEFEPQGSFSPSRSAILHVDNSITRARFAQLAKLERLESLSIHSFGIDGSGLALLARLPNLRSLSITNTNLDDADVPYLLTLKSLRELRIPFTKFSIDSLRSLLAMPNLTIFQFSQFGHTKEEIEEIQRLFSERGISRW